MTKHFTHAAAGQPLPTALAVFAGSIADDFAWALLYGPGQCQFARLRRDGTLESAAGAVDPANFFEARAFHADAELRWLGDPTGVAPRAAVVAESEVPLRRMGLTDFSATDVIETLDQTYLLWGRVARTAPGWVKLSAARVGRLDVPWPGPVLDPGTRLRLTAREYLVEAVDGNVAVWDERLTGVEVAS